MRLPFCTAAVLLSLIHFASAQIIDLPQVIVPRTFGGSGRYVGVVKVLEKVPVPPSTASLPIPPPGSQISMRSSARIQAVFKNDRLRVLAPPGSTLLGYLDEPSYASIAVQPIFATPNQFLGFVAQARKGVGAVKLQGDRLQFRFELTSDHLEFAAGDQTVSGTVVVSLDLVRTGD